MFTVARDEQFGGAVLGIERSFYAIVSRGANGAGATTLSGLNPEAAFRQGRRA
jgi:hypothetical protein